MASYLEAARTSAIERVQAKSGLDRIDEIRHQASGLAHRSAWERVRALRRIEADLLVVAGHENLFRSGQDDYALDVIRTHMVRGLIVAQMETGNRAPYWVAT